MTSATAAAQESTSPAQSMLGSEIIVKALLNEDVDTVFGYPGGAVLPLYDAMFKQNQLRHFLVRHEQGATHAAEGYARSTGKVGVVLVTSGPGATNAITGLTDAMLDSVPLVVITGQVPTHLIGSDAFQEADTTGITRSCSKYNYLVRNIEELPRIMHEAFHIARSGRPGPVVIDIPKNIMNMEGAYAGKMPITRKSYHLHKKGDPVAIASALQLMAQAKQPIFYTGGGVVNAGPKACELLRELVEMTGFPITNTLMGLGSIPGEHPQFLGMLGMHGSLEANMAMEACDVMINIGARFDDRVTGRLDAFSPNSTKIHVDIDPSSINKNVRVHIPIVGDAESVLQEMVDGWKAIQNAPPAGGGGKVAEGNLGGGASKDSTLAPPSALRASPPPPAGGAQLHDWWESIKGWRAKKSFSYKQSNESGAPIKPQYALDRLYELTKDTDPYVTTDVGQHQMWAAQFIKFDKPFRWMTSGGLGTMGYGLPSAIGVQVAHIDQPVVCVTGEASFMMNIQELATCVQYRLPVKVIILNNHYMGMVRQWQQMFHGCRYSESYMESLPDFVRLAEAFGMTGLRCDKASEVDNAITQMMQTPGPVILDMLVDENENVYPMIPAGAAHNELVLGPEDAEVELDKNQV